MERKVSLHEPSSSEVQDITRYRIRSPQFPLYSVYGVFTDAACSSDYIASSDGMSNDWERIWKEVVVA
jgi:hypothetical protein